MKDGKGPYIHEEEVKDVNINIEESNRKLKNGSS